MKCVKCGAELKENAKFCNQCGTQITKDSIVSSDCGMSNEIHDTESQQININQIKKNWKDQYTIFVLIVIMIVAGAGGMIVKNTSKNRIEEEYNNVEGNFALSEESGIEDESLFANEDIESVQIEQEEISENEEEQPELQYDATEGGIHEYGFYIDDCTWSEAFQKSQDNGGYLVHINSYDEYAYIIHQIYNLGYDKIQFRIGGRHNSDSKEYYWVDNNNDTYGEIINSSEYWAEGEWMQGEPSFVDGEIEENCRDFYYYEQEGRWVWNDVPDDIISIVPNYSGKIGYIVEYEN